MRGVKLHSLPLFLGLCVLVAMIAGACGGGSDTGETTFGKDAGVHDGTVPSDAHFLADVPTFGEAATGPLVLSPTAQVVNVTVGQPLPTLQFVTTEGGGAVAAVFSIDRGEIGAIGAGTGLFTPTGTTGGVANVTATYGGQTATTTVTVFIHYSQNGGAPNGDAGAVDAGSGGNGGVGGEGEGGQVGGGTQNTLNGNPTTDPGLAFLYPYANTVWPRGILAPLLQWQPGTSVASYDAVYIHIQEAAFEYQGYFAATATPFIHHPIPEDVWTIATYSNAGEPLVVTLVFSSGTTAYGPITESWKVAQGTLEGTVYYNSYGTSLALNSCCRATHNGDSNIPFGGATLAIQAGSTGPSLVAGTSVMTTGCRVCHSVSANGSTLVTVHGDDSYEQASAYALTNANAETTIPGANYTYSFPAIYPDGTFLFNNAAPLPGVYSLPAASSLYAIPSGNPLPVTGLPSLQAGSPVFSPDGKNIAFNDYSTDQASLALLPFTVAPDGGTNAFGAKVALNTPPAGERDLYPAFLPTNDAIVYELETQNDGEFGATRTNGAGGYSHGELWWVDVATKTATRLDQLNGKGYAPTGPNNHPDDTTLNYEPTVNPVPSGGYAWVVFTSRRLYGNVATIDPYSSDPRDFDLIADVTTKKLWVAAIDLNAAPGTDPSHPAFYLPGQELYAGNSRGYWVVNPCLPNNSGCQTGDECCGGYCEQGSDGGGLICTNQKPMCSQVDEKCTTDGDCCGASQGIECINGRCAQNVPK